MRRRLGRYELGRVLGEGGAGQVYDAVLHGPGGLRKPVALKVLHHGSEELRREARIGGLLRHRHLVDVYEIGEDDGTWFCAMERCEGSLASHLPLPPRAVVEAGMAVCSALQYAHDDLGLVHLDLKPDNLLFTADGTVKVADLGIARAEGFDDDRVRGTPGYMAPEQLRGGAVDARTDIYSLGVTLLELAGMKTTDAEATFDWSDDHTVGTTTGGDGEMRAAEPDLDVPWLTPIVERCISPGPADRWRDMGQLAEALAALPVEGPGLRQHLGLHRDQPEPLPSRGSNLGQEPDVFVGRAPELARLEQALEDPGVWTLKGPAGVGKSRLAAAVARRWFAEDRGQSWFCDLTDARSVEGLAFAVGRTLGVQLGKRDIIDQLGHAIAGRGPVVVVLDNFEQVAEHAGVVARWRRRAPQARFVITSRRALRLDGETVIDLDVLPREAATRLLMERARARGADIADDPDLPALAERLDGLPLALELAAGRLGVLSVRDVLDRLELGLLRRGTADRHGTLEAALDWSWELLGEAQRSALTQLSVFVGGFPLEAAETVVELPRGVAILDVLETLLERSWLRVRDDRFGMLEAVRRYAASHLAEAHAVQARHGAWVAGLLGAPETSDDLPQLRACTAELDNVVAACRRAVTRLDGDLAVGALKVSGRVMKFTGPSAAQVTLVRSVAAMELTPELRAAAERLAGRALLDADRPADAEEHLHAGLVGSREVGDSASEAEVLALLGVLHARQGRLDQAARWYREALEFYRRLDWPRGEGQMLSNLGNLHADQGRLKEARACYERALELHRAGGYRRAHSLAMVNLAVLDQEAGRLDEAKAGFERALVVLREYGDRRVEAQTLGNLAIVLHLQGRSENARMAFEEALAIHREVGQRRGEASTLTHLGILCAEDEGQLDEARTYFEAALPILREIGNRSFEAHVLGNMGELSVLQGQLTDARSHYDAALAIHRELRELRFMALTQISLAGLEATVGDLIAATDHLDSAEQLVSQLDDPPTHVRLLAQRSEVRVLCGDRAGAEAALRRAESIAPTGHAGCAAMLRRAWGRLEQP